MDELFIGFCSFSCGFVVLVYFFFFKQKTAYELRISDWSSDVCSSDLGSRRSQADASRRWPPAARSAEAGAALAGAARTGAAGGVDKTFGTAREIGRASCRERVCQYV